MAGYEFTQATSVLVTGDSRLAVNRAAYEFSRTINPCYLWLEVRTPHEPVNWREPSAQGLIPKNQLLTTSRPRELAPENTEVDMAVWKVVRSGGDPADVGHFVDFMRLPSMVQALFPDLTSRADHRPAVFSVVNGDRVVEFYPVSLENTRSLLEVFRQERITLVFAALDAHRPDQSAFDYIFRIMTDSETQRLGYGALCEKAPQGSTLQEGLSYEVLNR